MYINTATIIDLLIIVSLDAKDRVSTLGIAFIIMVHIINYSCLSVCLSVCEVSGNGLHLKTQDAISLAVEL